MAENKAEKNSPPKGGKKKVTDNTGERSKCGLDDLMITHLLSLHVRAQITRVHCDGIINFRTETDTIRLIVNYSKSTVIAVQDIDNDEYPPPSSLMTRQHEKTMLTLEGICAVVGFEFVHTDEETLRAGNDKDKDKEAPKPPTNKKDLH